ncbi:MAG TPA: HNH endonuclease signature motif containing protein [Candidatus Rubrimentiphilum sp.]|nr:HNH endonuclease signature motif containing protein [Candidatus Rubrimentiphilum sp.]
MLDEGILKNKCSRCGISEWQAKPISIQIDHINGINDDYRLENLRMLCANCHSLTPTHGRRNVGHKKRVPEISFLLAA